MTTIVLSVLTVLLLLCVFYQSLAEIAFFSISRLRLDYLARQGDKRALVVQNILKKPQTLLSAVMISNTVAHTVAPIIAAVVFVSFLDAEIGYTIASVVMTLIILIPCEIVPKVLASHYPEKVAFAIAEPTKIMIYTLKPFIWLTKNISNIFFRAVGIKIKPRDLTISREELRHMVKLSGEAGHIHVDEHKLLRAIFAFNDKLVSDVMIPRDKMIAVDIKKSQQEMVEFINNQGYTRIPVYEGNVDNIKGVIHAKDVLNALLYKELIIFQDLIREPYYISKEQKISEVLKMFQQDKLHIAVVKDESGKTAGVITMEDILEEIVGEIEDEFDVY
ncbi:MAG: hypothetical protein A2W23_05675 [Planctomycetes bacterium RBG_16_43_13]|nr:MAG: hypothetical protein A2W23_05675 [Planctomycetes bacterium RBG_16_43_13]